MSSIPPLLPAQGVNTAYARAAVPFIVMALLAMGVKISPELMSFAVEHIIAIFLSSGALAAVFPSFKAAFKYKDEAD